MNWLANTTKPISCPNLQELGPTWHWAVAQRIQKREVREKTGGTMTMALPCRQKAMVKTHLAVLPYYSYALRPELSSSHRNRISRKGQTNKNQWQTDIATYRLKRPSGQYRANLPAVELEHTIFVKKKCILYIFFCTSFCTCWKSQCLHYAEFFSRCWWQQKHKISTRAVILSLYINWLSH